MLTKRIRIHVFIVYCVFSFILSATCIAVSDLAYKEGELIVKFAPKKGMSQRTKAERNALLASVGGGHVKHSYKIVPGLTVVQLPPNMSVEHAQKLLSKMEGISYAVPNYVAKVLLELPNDPFISDDPNNLLWGLHNVGQMIGGIQGTPDADIDAPEAWDIHTDASNVIVAVIDTGVDYTHPDLAANMWVNETELNGISGIDDDDESGKGL